MLCARSLLFPALLSYGAVVDPTTGTGGVPCLWRLLFGIACPGCGLSHADALFVRGQFYEALEANWLILPIVLLALQSFTVEIVRYSHSRAKTWPS